MDNQRENSKAPTQLSPQGQRHPSGAPPFLGESGYVLGRVDALQERMAEAVYPHRLPLEHVEVAGPVDRIPLEEATALKYRRAELGETLGPSFATHWFRLKIQVPEEWKGRRVDLAWSSNSEALLWLNGRSMQGFNPGRETACLIEKAAGGDGLTAHVEVACNYLLGSDEFPGRRRGRSTRRSPHWFQMCEIRCFEPEAWDLYHDLRVLVELVNDRVPLQETRAIKPGQAPLVRPALDSAWAGELVYDLNTVCNVLDPKEPNTWPHARRILARLLAVHNGGVCHELSAIGHAHIDTAWLWPLAETYRKTVRTFSSAVRHMEDYPEYRFACSQAYQYECVERDNPDLFDRIKEKITAGHWIPVGGTYVEPDCNLPSGESLCRQFLYGQRYFESRFGRRCTEFWNPDVFGYAGQLPQIMRLAGIDNFLTQKLSWNRFTTPPHHTFYWESLDGSQVLTHFPPADTYNGTCAVEELRYHAANYKNSDRGRDAYYLFGHGDGGGGPTAEMLETLRRAGDLLGVPRCQQRTPEQFFSRLKENTRSIPTITGELYLEVHRGTYTSQAMMKRGLRKAERLLHDIELLGVLARSESQAEYPRVEMDRLWKRLLLNQFHDILPGSSIADVHEQARADFEWILEDGQAVRDGLLSQLETGRRLHQEKLPLNTTSCARYDVFEMPGRGLALIESPPVGFGRQQAVDFGQYKTDGTGAAAVSVQHRGGLFYLQNEHLSAVLAESGALVELTELESGWQLLSAPGNSLVLHEDRPSMWDAWDVEPSVLETGQACRPATHCQLQQRGPLRVELSFEHAIGQNSHFTQTVRLDAGARRLEFDCHVNWQERHRLLRVLFPTRVRAPRATFEMPFGFAERPTHCNTAADAAQFETPGHRWADLSEPGFGLALLTDCKYGFHVYGGVLALSLLRSPTYPDEQCDIGLHQFSYAAMPHSRGWREGRVVTEAITFNQPLLWVPRAGSDAGKSFFIVEGDLVLDTVKPAEDGEGIVVRMYDPYGQRGHAIFKTKVPFTNACKSNILEDDCGSIDLFTEDCDGDGQWTCVPVDYRPAEIVCLRLTPRRGPTRVS